MERLNKNEKMIVLMKYLNEEGVSIPNVRNNIRFCDIDHNISDTSYAGTWIQSCMKDDADGFIQLCVEYSRVFPLAYKKMSLKFLKRNMNDVNMVRLDCLVQYLMNGSINEKTRFCDIGLNADETLVLSWFKRQKYNNHDMFMKNLVFCCSKYGMDVNDVTHLLDVNQDDNKESKLDKRFYLFMKYVNENDFPSRKDKVRFCEIDSNSRDTTYLYAWFERVSVLGYEVFYEGCKNYSEEFPLGFQKVTLRMGKFINHSRMLNTSFEEKVRILIKYLDSHEFPMSNSQITFHDIDCNCLCETPIMIWFCNEAYLRLNHLNTVMKSYEKDYPIGYQRFMNRINGSLRRIKTARLLLLGSLIQIRNSVVNQSGSSYVKKLEKN